MVVNVASKYNQIPTDLDEILSRENGDLLKKKVGYETKKLWTEFQLIVRLIYRSKNQHKASFSFKHLMEIKRLGERIGKAELWLKANFVENGEKLFDFVGFLNTLIILIDKTIFACGKTFYFYSHYLEQGHFVPLALVAVGNVSTLHNELIQWKKYSKLLYFTILDKLKIQNGEDKVSDWCKINYLELSPPAPDLVSKNTIPTKLKSTSEPSTSNPTPATSSVKKKSNLNSSYKRKKLSSEKRGCDEIDDIFSNM